MRTTLFPSLSLGETESPVGTRPRGRREREAFSHSLLPWLVGKLWSSCSKLHKASGLSGSGTKYRGPFTCGNGKMNRPSSKFRFLCGRVCTYERETETERERVHVCVCEREREWEAERPIYQMHTPGDLQNKFTGLIWEICWMWNLRLTLMSYSCINWGTSSWSGLILVYRYWTPFRLCTLNLMSDAVNVVKNHVASCTKQNENMFKTVHFWLQFTLKLHVSVGIYLPLPMLSQFHNRGTTSSLE